VGEANFRFMIARYAQRFQTPAKRTEVSVLLYSEEEGTAKNTLYNIIKYIFGRKYFQELATAELLTEKNSTIEDGKMFILVNEADPKTTHSNFDKIKDKITCPDITFRPLYIQAFTTRNFNDYEWSSNNIACLKLTKHNRRFFAVETSTYYLGNKDYFKAFYEDIVECPRALRVIAEYFLKFDVKAVVPSGNFQADMPKTELMLEMYEHNKDYIAVFLEDKGTYENVPTNSKTIKEGEGKKAIESKTLFRLWCDWCEKSNIQNQYNVIGFSSRLTRVIKSYKLEYITKITNTKAMSGYYIDMVKYKGLFPNFIEDE
jgi:phage/plasmid-associated DNA primase